MTKLLSNKDNLFKLGYCVIRNLLNDEEIQKYRSIIKKISRKFPESFQKTLHRAEEFSKGFVSGGTLFEELGFFYLGPIDGHNFDHLIPVLKNIKFTKIDKPIFCWMQKPKTFCMQCLSFKIR